MNEMSSGAGRIGLAMVLWMITGSIANAAGGNLPSSSIYGRFEGIAYKVVAGYGTMKRMDGKRFKNPHTGVDFDTPYGTPIYANFSGHVHEIKPNSHGGMEVYVMIDPQTLLGFVHLSRVYVQLGDRVEAGKTLLGLSGTTVGGDHLDYSVWKKQADHTWKHVDPMQYLISEDGRMACLGSGDFWDFVAAGYQGKGPKHPWPACRQTEVD